MIVLKKILSIAILYSLICQSAFSYFPMDDDATLVSELVGFGNATFIKNYAVNRDSVDADFSVGSRTGTFTASRGASNPATYVDGSGVIQVTTTSNAPRLTSGFYDSTGFVSTGFVSRPGLIVEGAGTNLLPYGTNATDSNADGKAEGIAQSGTSDITGTPTYSLVDASDITSISGAKWQRVQYTGVAGDAAGNKNLNVSAGITPASSVAVGNVVTVSGFYKGSVSGATVKMLVLEADNAGTGTGTSQLSSEITPISTIKRFSFTFTIADAGCLRLYFRPLQISNIGQGDTIDLYFILQDVVISPFAQTPIPNGTSGSLTRNAETLTYPIAGNRTAATESIFVKFTPFGNGSGVTNPTLSNTETKERLLFFNEGGNQKLKAYPNLTDTIGSTAVGTTNLVVSTSYVASFILSSTGDPNITIYLNGATNGTGSNTDFTAPAWGTNFYVGSRSSSSQLFGIISSIAIFSDAKSAGDVLAISNLLTAG